MTRIAKGKIFSLRQIYSATTTIATTTATRTTAHFLLNAFPPISLSVSLSLSLSLSRFIHVHCLRESYLKKFNRLLS